MSNERAEKLMRRKKICTEALSSIEDAMINTFKTASLVRDQPFFDEIRKDLEKANERMREAQRKLIVEIYDTDKDLASESS
jgi:hypothetical protein